MPLLQIRPLRIHPQTKRTKSHHQKKAKSQFFSFMEDEDDEVVNVTGKSIVDDEIDCYLKEPCKKVSC